MLKPLMRMGVAATQPRTAATAAWVSNMSQKAGREPGALDAGEKQQLDRAGALLARWGVRMAPVFVFMRVRFCTHGACTNLLIVSGNGAASLEHHTHWT